MTKGFELIFTFRRQEDLEVAYSFLEDSIHNNSLIEVHSIERGKPFWQESSYSLSLKSRVKEEFNNDSLITIVELVETLTGDFGVFTQIQSYRFTEKEKEIELPIRDTEGKIISTRKEIIVVEEPIETTEIIRHKHTKKK
jgi:hypothetical protein